MTCTFCRGTLKPIEDPAAKAGLRCVSCGTVETAAMLMARALEKAVRVQIDMSEGHADHKAVDAFLKSLGMGPPK